MKDKELNKIITDFVAGLLKVAKVKHAGNCLAVSRVLKTYLSVLCDMETIVMNCKVKQGRRKINHYYLTRVKDGIVIDGTASQFKYPNGEHMPTVFIGRKPEHYL